RIQNLLDRPSHVALDRARELLFRRKRRIQLGKARKDAREKQLNIRMELLSVMLRSERRLDRAASLVTQDDKQRDVQVRARVLQRSGDFRRVDVSGDTDDEQLSHGRIENQFRR